MTRPVLIADDSAVARRTLARRIREVGLEVLEHDSCEAASSVDGSTLACALLDLDLGDGSGLDVAVRLRAAHATLPIAFFTATIRDASRLAEFGPVFAKPDDLDAAVDWIARAGDE